MNRSKDIIPVHETFRVAALLAVVGGFLDAYTYILRGGVFANAQTGNIVLLGIHLAEEDYGKALYCIVPIAAFAVGVFITDVFKKIFSEKGFNIYEYYIIVIEIILLTIVGVIPASVPDGVVNVTISFVCSLQVNSFRKIKNMPYATTMCTGNLRSGTDKLFQYLINKEKNSGVEAAHYFGIIALFIIGAILGTILVKDFGIRSIWFCCMLLAVVFGLMCASNQTESCTSGTRREDS